jgi:hypothetical protein
MSSYHWTTLEVVVVVAPFENDSQSCDPEFESTLEHALIFWKCMVHEHVSMILVSLDTNNESSVIGDLT